MYYGMQAGKYESGYINFKIYDQTTSSSLVQILSHIWSRKHVNNKIMKG